MVMAIDWAIMVVMPLSKEIISVFKGGWTSFKCRLVLKRHLE